MTTEGWAVRHQSSSAVKKGWRPGRQRVGGVLKTWRFAGESSSRNAESARARLAEVNAPNKALFQSLEQAVNSFCPGLARTPYHIGRYGGGHHDCQHGGAHRSG